MSELAARADVSVKEMDANLQAAVAIQELQVEALKAVANIQAQKAASALTSVSASAQVGYNGSLSESYSKSGVTSDIYSDSHSQSDSESKSDLHIYNES